MQHLVDCKTGDAKITSGYSLPAKYIIHAVGPIYNNYETTKEAEDLLKSCYRRSLEIAEEKGLKSIAFPAISTGIFGYPKKDAARAVHEVVEEFKSKAVSVNEIRFILFSKEDLAIYQNEFNVK